MKVTSLLYHNSMLIVRLFSYLITIIVIEFSLDRFGMHEDYDYYMDCKYRNRNKGLFTADQVIRN